MKCLCCNKIINSNDITKQELQYSWHNKCIKSFFGVNIFPEISLSDDILINYINNNINNNILITGVQKKLSLGFENNNKRLTLSNYPTGYILKPNTLEYDSLPELEYIGMTLANIVGLHTVPNGLIKIDNEYAYITKRIDRILIDNKIKLLPKLLPMEDFCQLSNKLTNYKYNGSYEQCAKIIDKYSNMPGFDKTELFILVLFSYIIGNSDLHLKNLSLISEDNINYHLSKRYDILPVKIILKEDNEELALTINNKNKNINKDDFIIFGNNIGLSNKQILKIINNIISKQQIMKDIINDSVLNNNLKQELIEYINKQIDKLK